MNRETRVVLLVFSLILAAGFGFLMWANKKTVPPTPAVQQVVEEKKEEKKTEVKKVVHKKVVKRDRGGWLPYMTIGRNPYAPHRTLVKDRKILEKKGYTQKEIEEYLELREKGKGIHMAFFKEQKFLWVVFGNARMVEKLRAVWHVPQPGTLYQLKSGRNVVVLDECENLAEVPPRPIPPKKEEVPPPPVVEEVPPPPVAEVPPTEVPLLVEVPVMEEKKEDVNCLNSLKRWDPKLFVGHERQPSHGGDSMESTFLSAALYCTWRGEDQETIHGLGAALETSWFHGTVNHGAGKFKGWLLGGGPAYERIMKGKDLEVRLLFGALHEEFRQGGFRNHRDFGVVGPSINFNDYTRRERGEKWLHETQLFGRLLIPFTSDLEHSFDDKPLTGDPDNLDAQFMIGVKEWLYDNPYVQPYVQLTYFLEAPGAESLGFRAGIADPNRFCGVGVGVDFDLKNGGEVLGWGPWCDLAHGARFARAQYRTSQTTDVTGIGGVTVSSDGFIMVPFEEGNASVSSSGQPNPSGSQNGNAVAPQDIGGR